MLNVAVFLPTYIEGRNLQEDGWDTGSGHEKLDAGHNAQIIAIFSIAQIMNAPFNAAIKNYLGAKNNILLGFSLMTATTFGLGLISALSSPSDFYYVAMVLRFFQGQGDVMIQFTGYAVITSVFSD